MATKKVKVAEKEKTTSKKSKATKKVTDEQLKRLTELGYAGDGEEDAVKKFLVSFLEKNELEGTDEQDIDSLLDIAELFEVEETEEEETEEETEEMEDDGDDEEMEEETEEEEEEEETEEEEEEDFSKEEIKEKPKKNSKEEKPLSKKRVTKAGLTAFSWDDEKSKKILAPILSYFPTKNGFEVCKLKRGFTIRQLGKNAKITVCAFDRLRMNFDEKYAIGAFFVHKVKTAEDLVKILPKKFSDYNIAKFPGEHNPSIRSITSVEVAEILEKSKLIENSLIKAKAVDKKLGENSKKLYDSLTKENTSKKNSTIKKVKLADKKETEKVVKAVVKDVKSKKKVKK